jgi:metacaspase-1
MNRALLVGINAYRNSPLRGCVNDCMQVKQLLTDYYGFTPDTFKLLLDEQATSANIKAGLEWLADGGSDPDIVRVFHYSGHGSYVADVSGDEPDGQDETLVPVDYTSAGMLTDDTLKTFYHRFPAKSNLTLIMDSCHSGSVNRLAAEDVVFRFLPVSRAEEARISAAREKFGEDQRAYVRQEIQKMRSENLSDAELDARIEKAFVKFEKKRYGDIRTREGNILLAGCRPDQQCADAFIAGDYHGAFTYYLAKAISDSNGQLTYRQMVERTDQGLSQNGYAQIPQLEYRSKRDGKQAFRPFST